MVLRPRVSKAGGSCYDRVLREEGGDVESNLERIGRGEEVRDIREAVGEDWATESSLHLFKVIRLIGHKLTEEAFLHLPSVAEERAVST